MTINYPVLHVKNIAYNIGEAALLKGVDLTVQSGEALIIRGGNGVGKTTLLRIIAGLIEPSHGSVLLRFEGDDFEGDGDVASHAASDNIHYLGHKNALKAQLTVEQNIAFWRQFGGGDGTSIEAAATALEIKKFLYLPVAVMSAGQKRRTAFARLLTSKRPIWLLDEPTAALDVYYSNLIETLARAHLQQGGIIIAATHTPFLEGEGDASRIIDLSRFKPARAETAHD